MTALVVAVGEADPTPLAMLVVGAVAVAAVAVFEAVRWWRHG